MSGTDAIVRYLLPVRGKVKLKAGAWRPADRGQPRLTIRAGYPLKAPEPLEDQPMDPDYSKRDYLLPKGCKDLLDVLNLQPEKVVAQPLRPQPLTFAPIAAITGELLIPADRGFGASVRHRLLPAPRAGAHLPIGSHSCFRAASIDRGDGRHPFVVPGEVTRFRTLLRMRRGLFQKGRSPTTDAR